MIHDNQLFIDISDTARWVAFYRALESERDDALFRDPFARRLAGASGEKIVSHLPEAEAAAPTTIVRSYLFDQLIERTVTSDAMETVLNLAAGLDTRPYRLALPSTLRWVEVDLPILLDYKDKELAAEKPVCGLERIPLDLRDHTGRRDLFYRMDATSSRILVITEGLLAYLERGDVAMLAMDLYELRSCKAWLLDLMSPLALYWARTTWGKYLAAAHAEMRFAPPEGIAFFNRYGWVAADFHSLLSECQRLNRIPRPSESTYFPGQPSSRDFQSAMPYLAAIVLLQRMQHYSHLYYPVFYGAWCPR